MCYVILIIFLLIHRVPVPKPRHVWSANIHSPPTPTYWNLNERRPTAQQKNKSPFWCEIHWEPQPAAALSMQPRNSWAHGTSDMSCSRIIASSFSSKFLSKRDYFLHSKSLVSANAKGRSAFWDPCWSLPTCAAWRSNGKLKLSVKQSLPFIVFLSRENVRSRCSSSCNHTKSNNETVQAWISLPPLLFQIEKLNWTVGKLRLLR